MAEVNGHEARNALSRRLKDAEASEDVVITNHLTPLARIVPIGQHRGADILRWLRADPTAAGSQRTAEAIDAELAELRDSWE